MPRSSKKRIHADSTSRDASNKSREGGNLNRAQTSAAAIAQFGASLSVRGFCAHQLRPAPALPPRAPCCAWPPVFLLAAAVIARRRRCYRAVMQPRRGDVREGRPGLRGFPCATMLNRR